MCLGQNLLLWASEGSPRSFYTKCTDTDQTAIDKLFFKQKVMQYEQRARIAYAGNEGPDRPMHYSLIRAFANDLKKA